MACDECAMPLANNKLPKQQDKTNKHSLLIFSRYKRCVISIIFNFDALSLLKINNIQMYMLNNCHSQMQLFRVCKHLTYIVFSIWTCVFITQTFQQKPDSDNHLQVFQVASSFDNPKNIHKMMLLNLHLPICSPQMHE